MIEVEHLTKHYGPKTALEDVSFRAHPGRVTGLLGPNGAGKSTAMRLMVDLDRPSSGRAIISGRPFAVHESPLRQVGVLLEARAANPGRSARNHLLSLAATHGIDRQRVHRVLAMAGLLSVADRRIRGFSLGMTQRLGIAAAMLGDPATLILDEPVNGLDPEGVLWIRTLLRELAAQGRTVLLSSHLMAEMALTADHLIVLGRGKVLADAPADELIRQVAPGATRVRTPQPHALRQAIEHGDVRVALEPDGQLAVTGMTAEQIGDEAARRQIPIHMLVSVERSLEDVFLELTRDQAEHRSRPATGRLSGGSHT